MRKLFYFLASVSFGLSIGCSTPVDPISHLAAELSQTYGLWQNGKYPTIDLPAKAAIEDVVSKVFEAQHFSQGPVTSHQIVEVKPVNIGGQKMTGVLVDTNLGRKIILLHYLGQGGWWSRVYEFEVDHSG